MIDAFSPPPRKQHRYVPTLTEVVQQSPVDLGAANATSALELSPEQIEEIVDRSLRRAEEALTQRLPEILAVLLHEQALATSERLRREIRATVRQSVTAALTEKFMGSPVNAQQNDAD